MLDDGEVEIEIAASLRTVTPRLFKGHSMCNEKACLQRKTCKLKNATDVVQDYLDELSNRGKQAAEVGRPDSAAAHGDNAVSDSGNTDCQDAVVAKPKRGRGRPRNTGITKPAQERGGGQPRKQP